jgi:hypothetical protein
LVRTNKGGKKYNALAGNIRNKKMAEYIKETDCVALGMWDGKSSGTKNMISILCSMGVRTFVYNYETGEKFRY